MSALPLCATACGGGGGGAGSEFHGDYETTEILLELGACTGAGTQQPIDPSERYFRLDTAEFFGVEFLGWYHCDAPGTCDADADLGASFFQEGNELAGGFTAWGGMPCQITASRRTIARVDGTTIRVVEEQRSGEAPEIDCDTATSEEIAERAESLPCTQQMQLTATSTSP